MRGIMLLFVFIVIALLIGFAATRGSSDAPRKRDMRRLHAENQAMRRLLNDLDAEARADYTVTQSALAWSVSDRIAKTRTGELN